MHISESHSLVWFPPPSKRLASGTAGLNLTATDAQGNASGTNLSSFQSGLDSNVYAPLSGFILTGGCFALASSAALPQTLHHIPYD